MIDGLALLAGPYILAGILNGIGQSRSYSAGSIHGEARWATENDLKQLRAFEKLALPVGYLNGKEFSHPARRMPHGLVIGGTGVGKTTRVLVPLALGDAASKRSLVYIDTVGDLTGLVMPYRSKLGPAYLLDPAGMSKKLDIGSAKVAHYNPMDFVDAGDPLRFSGKAAKLASANVRKTSGTRDPYWYIKGQSLYQGVLMAEAKHGARARRNLPALAEIIYGDFAQYARHMVSRDIDPHIRQMLQPYAIPKDQEGAIRSLPEVLETVRSEIGWQLNQAVAETMVTSDFSFRQCSQEVTTIGIMAPLNLLDEGLERWLSMLVNWALTELQYD